MMQPTGVVPPPRAPMSMDQQQYQQTAPLQHQQQWMMMPPQQQQPMQPQPPPAGWAPSPVLPPQQSQSQPPAQQYASAGQLTTTTGSDEIRSLWIGDLQSWMDENYLISCLGLTGEALSAKVIRNKITQQPEGYGFIEFASRAAAERVLQTYNGALMPNSEQAFRLNWATLGAGERRANDGPDFTVFVGDLAADVTDYMLQETFRVHYSTIKGAKVVTDRTTGRSKGYGFVRFGDEIEHKRALTEMNGLYCSTRPMRIGEAATKKPVGVQQYQKAYYPTSAQVPQGEDDPNNTTIFVGGLDPSVTEENLRQLFGTYGDLVHTKIPVGKRCGFVQFANRSSAEQAKSLLNGTQLGGQSIRLSWGRSPSNKQGQQDQAQYGGYYGYPQQGYEAYGYAPPAAQDPNMYYAGYPAGYGNYQPQQ